MKSRLRLAAVAVALLGGVGVAVPTVASAGTSDVTWALDQTTTTYGAPTLFHISSDGSAVDYRWIDTLTKDTVISANRCSDGSAWGVTSIGAGDTSYHRLFSYVPTTCFTLRGRVASGQGATTTRTGRLSR